MDQRAWRLRKRVKELEARIESVLDAGATYDDDYIQNLTQDLHDAQDDLWEANLKLQEDQ